MLKDLIQISKEELENVFNDTKEKFSKYFNNYSRELFDYLMGVHPDNHLETGIYEFFGSNIPGGFTFSPTGEQEFDCLKCYNLLSPYGVADNLEQIKNYFEKPINDPNKNFIIIVNKIYQKDQPEQGGWRWHKWGKYIGQLNPKCEYLYNENFGDDWQGYVYTFHIIGLD